MTVLPKEEAEQDGWQLIDSAPKDGSMFLAYNEVVGVYSTSYTKWWRNEDGTADTDYRGFPCGQWGGALGRWDCCPTHWRPLPPIPGAAPSHPSDDAEMREALVAAQQAINDWVCVYAPDECNPEHVEAARSRLNEGGTLAYQAEVLGKIRFALLAPQGKEG